MSRENYIYSRQRKQASARNSIESFDIFPWIDDFETNIAFMDEQHQTLVRLLNELAKGLIFQPESLSFDEVLRELSDYATYHFEAEEAMMQEVIGGDILESGHRHTHSLFVEELGRLIGQSRTRPERKKIEGIVAFLSHWLANHILESDRRMAMVVLAVKAGVPLEEAKAQADLEMSGTVRELIDAVLAIYEKLSSRSFQLMKEIIVRGEAGGQPASMQQIEWEHIQRVLLKHDGNISATARALNINRRTLQRKLRKPAS